MGNMGGQKPAPVCSKPPPKPGGQSVAVPSRAYRPGVWFGWRVFGWLVGGFDLRGGSDVAGVILAGDRRGVLVGGWVSRR